MPASKYETANRSEVRLYWFHIVSFISGLRLSLTNGLLYFEGTDSVDVYELWWLGRRAILVYFISWHSKIFRFKNIVVLTDECVY